MAPRTRYFLIGSALIVAVGLGTGLVAYYGGVLPTRAARMTELNYLPPGASVVGYANVSDIMGAEFRTALKAMLPGGDDKAEFKEATGVDIEQDIDAVFVALSPGADASTRRGVVLVRGRFDAAKIESVAMAHGAAAETYGDVRLMVSPAGGGDALATGIAFLEPGLLALGTLDDLRGAIDAENGQSAADDADLLQAISQVERTGNAWFVARTSTLGDGAELPEIFRQRFDDVRWLSVGADVAQNVRALVRAEAETEQAALDLRAVINGAIAAARLVASQDARFEGVLNSIQTSASGTSVEMQFTLPVDVLDAARQFAPVFDRAPAE